MRLFSFEDEIQEFLMGDAKKVHSTRFDWHYWHEIMKS